MNLFLGAMKFGEIHTVLYRLKIIISLYRLFLRLTISSI